MAWSGGSFSRTNGDNTGTTTWAQDEADGFGITSGRHDTHDQDLATGINACLTKDGANTPSTNPSWIHNAHYLGTSGGSSNAYTATPSISISAYSGGRFFWFFPNHDCTGASTMNISSVGTRNIKKQFGGALYDPSPGDIRSGMPCVLFDDGTQLLLQNHGNVIDRATTVADVTNSVSKGNLYLKSIVGNTLGSYGRLVFEGNLDIDVGSGVPNLTLRIEYGSTILYTRAYTTLSETTTTERYFGQVRAQLVANASASAQRSSGVITIYNSPSNAGTAGIFSEAAATDLGNGWGASSTATETSSGALDFKVTAQWSAASTNHSIRLINGVLRFE